MKKIHLGFVLSLIILFSYQNCERPPYQPTTTQAPNENQIIDLTHENIQSVTLQSSENTTVQQNSKVFTLVSRNSYVINYQTGEINKSSNASSNVIRYCLNSNLLNELHDILSSAQICKTENTVPAGQLCTMQYKLGYAQLITSRDEIDLGSGDVCSANKIDFCQSSTSEMLKGWFAAVKNQLPQLNCVN